MRTCRNRAIRARWPALLSLALGCVVIAAHPTPAAARAPSVATPIATAQLAPMFQVRDLVNAVERALSGRSGQRSRRRQSRGSDRPILDAPPTLPARRPNRQSIQELGEAASLRPAATPADPPVTPTDTLPAAPGQKQSPARRDAADPTNPATTSTASVALPSRRPPPPPGLSPTPRTTTARNATASAAKSAKIIVAEENPAAPSAPATRWTAEQISEAYAKCERILRPLEVSVKPVAPMRRGACGMPAPVALSALGDKISVRVRPPATLNCPTVARLHVWMEKHVQPAASELLGARVAQIRNVSSYACRNRNNAKTGKLSQHAYGNALDIAGFTLTDGRKITLLTDWGPVARDAQAEAKASNATTDRATKTARPKAIRTARRPAPRRPSASTERPTPAASGPRVPLPEFKGPVSRGKRLYQDATFLGGAIEATAATPSSAEQKVSSASPIDLRAAAPEAILVAEPSAESRFLKRIHREACEVFGTVLGPEANDAHRDHFHLDTAPRRRRAYCR
ncbi:MAG: extensin family protein [Pseudomonadota bacterium]